MASQLPRHAPCRRIASIAYTEQVGSYRQLRGKYGESKY